MDAEGKLDSANRNKHIKQIVRDVELIGYSWTQQLCRTKIKNITQKYRKVARYIAKVY